MTLDAASPEPLSPQRILVVDDSRAIGMAVTRSLASVTDLPIDYADSFKACEQLLTEHGSAYQAAVVDLNLPDAPDGQAVDLVLGNGIATIVLTGMLDESLHARISSKPIVDYVVKQNPGAIETVQRDVRRVLRNRERKALVVDDSVSYRAYLKTILATQRLQVIEAGDGRKALERIERWSVCPGRTIPSWGCVSSRLAPTIWCANPFCWKNSSAASIPAWTISTTSRRSATRPTATI
ncbi:MAG: hypothetical protein IPG66_04470 [Hydrogenophilales bacterium]|nr:hypothetical protein [Hydrogenophilales bacterium]